MYCLAPETYSVIHCQLNSLLENCLKPQLVGFRWADVLGYTWYNMFHFLFRLQVHRDHLKMLQHWRGRTHYYFECMSRLNKWGKVWVVSSFRTRRTICNSFSSSFFFNAVSIKEITGNYISRMSNIESNNSQNGCLEDYNNISDGIFPHFTTPFIKISLG